MGPGGGISDTRMGLVRCTGRVAGAGYGQAVPGRIASAMATFRARLAVITLVGAAWRFLYLFVLKWNRPLLLNDSMYYSIQAGLNAEGSWFKHNLTDFPGAEHGPLTSLYLTPWSFGGTDGVNTQRLGITLLGIATVAVIGLVGRRAVVVGGLRQSTADHVGLMAAAIAAAYPNLWINDSLVMSETPAVLLVSLALLVALAHHQQPTVANGLLLGLVTGLATLARSEIALFAVGFTVLSVLVCRRRTRRVWPAVAIAGATIATLAPWTIYNAGRFDERVLLTTNDGNTLLGANCDRTYYDDIGGWDVLCLGPLRSGGLGHDPWDADPSEESLERREQAVDYVRDHLGRVPIVVAARIGRALDVYGLDSLLFLDTGEEKDRPAAWAGIVCWWVLAPCAVIGWRSATRRRLAARWWLLVPAIAVLVTTIVFYGAHRIRAPAEPSVVVFAAIGIVTMVERRRAAARIRESGPAPVLADSSV